MHSNRYPAVYVALSCAFMLLSMGGASADAQLTRSELLADAYPEAEAQLETIFLTFEQVTTIAKLSGNPVPSPVIARYFITRAGRLIGRAYVDTHVIRTKRESLLISLNHLGQVLRIDVTAFLEPREYQASRTWLDQYNQRALSDDLQIQRAIRAVTGATLTARATNQAVRRVLAIDQVLQNDVAP
ncbi:MAG: FMN-binding protein [Acidobacteriota bacterium]|nr:FMN-binding protein [Acidobacteriota bacterium]